MGSWCAHHGETLGSCANTTGPDLPTWEAVWAPRHRPGAQVHAAGPSRALEGGQVRTQAQNGSGNGGSSSGSGSGHGCMRGQGPAQEPLGPEVGGRLISPSVGPISVASAQTLTLWPDHQDRKGWRSGRKLCQ